MVTLNNQINNSRDCKIGILIMQQVNNVPADENLKLIKNDVTDSLRTRYGKTDRKELKQVHPIDVYSAYYKKFGYTYHLLLQIESIIKGKSLPEISLLVDSMFIAEMKNMLLTAGHDLKKVVFPLYFKDATDEKYVAMNGKSTDAVPGDILIADSEGVISSILRGPDQRTGISVSTKNVLYTVYAPSGIEEDLVYRHLDDIESYVRTGSDESVTSSKTVISNAGIFELYLTVPGITLNSTASDK